VPAVKEVLAAVVLFQQMEEILFFRLLPRLEEGTDHKSPARVLLLNLEALVVVGAMVSITMLARPELQGKDLLVVLEKVLHNLIITIMVPVAADHLLQGLMQRRGQREHPAAVVQQTPSMEPQQLMPQEDMDRADFKPLAVQEIVVQPTREMVAGEDQMALPPMP